jgi:trimeric autotransporter adhesin
MLTRRVRTPGSRAVVLLFAVIAFASTLCAQTAAVVANRITQPIDETSRVTLHGNVHPLANAQNDRGAAPDSMQLSRLHLVLTRSPAQEAALRQELQSLHTPGSSSYHKWLTPAAFGAQYGPSDQDTATVEAWLSSHGFNVSKVSPGKEEIEFSGNVAQLRDAFGVQIHKYEVSGETHYANADDPQIPAALAPVVGGFVSLNNFRPQRFSRLLGQATYNPKTGQATPQWTTGSGTAASSESYVLSPADYAVQYDLTPLYSAGVNGSGQTIAIVNDSNINVATVNQFRSLFGLSANPPQVILDGNDPGVDGINNPDGPNGDSVEAYLDVEWAGAVAPNATVDLVIAADTDLELGLVLALEDAVESNLAPVLSFSFGTCEAALGASGNQFLNALWEQAAAQGITVVVATGDSGAAACDLSAEAYAVDGLGVSGYASTPWNVAVGGTDFYYTSWNQGAAAQNTQLATYWNPTPSNSAPATSILGVIPEQAWNDSQYGDDILSYFTLFGTTTIAGGGGGASSCAVYTTSGTCSGGYTKPSWQTGSGVPNDGVRDLPDVSLFAADGANLSYIPECYQDGDCQPASSGSTVQITAVGGTSAAAPAFAGVMALVNQKYGPQGQADFTLYPLATQFPSVFHDVQNGTNTEPCSYALGTLDSPNCIAVANAIAVTDPSTGIQVTEGELGSGTTADYNAAAGYDLATGWGSIDANQLVMNWGSVKFAATGVTLTPSSTSFAHGTSITISGTVTGTNPGGRVALETSSLEPFEQGQGTFAVTNGSYSGSISILPGGTYDIWGLYGGDGSNGGSTSAKTSITVTPEASTLDFNVLNAGTPYSGSAAINPGALNLPYGTQLTLSGEPFPTSYYTQCIAVALQPASCASLSFTTPTGTVSFSDNGTVVNTAVLNSEGDAEFNAPWGVGSHSVTASYSGDSSYNSSTAAAIPFTVAKDVPAIALGSAAYLGGNAFLGGQATTFNVLVGNSANFALENALASSGVLSAVPVAPPTGTITVSGFPSGVPTSGTLAAAVDPGSAAAEGVATITAPANTPTGSYNLSISYSGDANYAATTQVGTIAIENSSQAGLAVGTLGSTTSASSTASATSPTASLFVNVTVTGQSGQAAPTGSVLLTSQGTTLGTAMLTPGTGDSSTISNIELNSQTLFQGSNQITVQYLGDKNYGPSSTTLTISNALSDFSMVPVSSLVSVPASGNSTDTINLTSVNGFAGTVNLSCAVSGGPSGATAPSCMVTSSVALTASTGSIAARQRWTFFGGGVALACILLWTVPARRRNWRAMLGMLLLAGVLGFGLGCGSSNSSSSSSGSSGSGSSGGSSGGSSAAASLPTATLTIISSSSTTAGSYSVLVSGVSGSQTHTLGITAIVQ